MKQVLEILERMDTNDPNVVALKKLINSYINQNKVYHLQYKNKKPVMVTITSNEDAEYCNDTTVSLGEYGDSVWYTNDLMTAAYNKYVSTPWFNSNMETCEHNYNPEDIEIVDNHGIVYNTKPLTNRTICIIKNYMRGKGIPKDVDEDWFDIYASLSSYSVIEDCKKFKPKPTTP